MTCALVTISPDGSMINPEPNEAARGPTPPGAPLSPKKSRNRSSSDVPGDADGVSCAVFGGAGAGAWVVEMLTTTPSRCPASCEKTSAKGVSGACATDGTCVAGAGGGAAAEDGGAGEGAGAGTVGAAGAGAGACA